MPGSPTPCPASSQPLTHSHTSRSKCRACCCGVPYRGHRLQNENILVLSVIQILCGVAAVVLAAVAITKQVFMHELATGVWSGALMLVTGVHGLVTSRRKGPCTLIGLLVLSVLVAITAIILACVSTAGLVMDGALQQTDQGKGENVGSAHVVVLHSLLLVVGCLEASVAIASSVLCCQQVCCRVGLEAGRTYLFTDPSSAAAAVSVGGNTRESRELSDVLMRAANSRGQIPVVTPSGATARASVLFVVPSLNPDEPVLVFPPFPPAYSASTASADAQPLFMSNLAGAASSSNPALRPAILLEEEPPEYSTVDRYAVPSGEGAGRHPHRRRRQNREDHSRPHSVAESARPVLLRPRYERASHSDDATEEEEEQPIRHSLPPYPGH